MENKKNVKGIEKGLAVYVDPEYKSHRGLVNGIESLGFTVLPAGSGCEGIKAIAGRSVEIAVIDTDLRDMNGIKLGAIIRERNDCPTVFLSRGPTAAFKAAVKAIDGASIISKNLDKDELLTQIDMCHANSNKLRESVNLNKRLIEKLEKTEKIESMLGAYMTIWEEDHPTVKSRLVRFARSRRMSLEELADYHREHSEAEMRIKDELRSKLVAACPTYIRELIAFYAQENKNSGESDSR